MRLLISVSVCVLLLTGTYSAISTKVLYGLSAQGTYGVHVFAKPYFMTMLMFVGELLCLAGFYVKEKCFNKGNRDTAVNTEDNKLLETDPKPVLPKPPVYYYLPLAMFDLTATNLNNVGLLWVAATVNQMMRGSMVLFTAIASLIILKVRLSRNSWLAIAVSCVGIALVGLSGVFRDKVEDVEQFTGTQPTPLDALIGIILILGGSAFNSVQGVLEEKLLKGDKFRDVDPLEVVGWEGAFGLAISAFIMMPIVQAIPGPDGGSYENTLDTLTMMKNSAPILLLCIGYVVMLALFNFTSQVVSKYLSAVHRMLLNALRTIIVWVVDLLIFYLGGNAALGESWDVFSWLQLGGFIILCIGSGLYVKSRQKPAEGEGIVKDRPGQGCCSN